MTLIYERLRCDVDARVTVRSLGIVLQDLAAAGQERSRYLTLPKVYLDVAR